MIDILKMGKKKRTRYEFNCYECGTRFRADEEDLSTLYKGLVGPLRAFLGEGTINIVATINCPVCGVEVSSSKTVEEDEEGAKDL